MWSYSFLLAALCLVPEITWAQFPPFPPGPPPFDTTTFNVTMSDGLVLTSTLYTLKGVTLGDATLAIHYQTFPYSAEFETFFAMLWALDPLLKLERHHGLLMQHMRGCRPGSGTFEGFHSFNDIKDTVAWLHNQSWWNGVLFGTGYSAMGALSYMSMLIGIDFTAQSVGIAAGDEYHFVYQNGAFRKQLVNGMLKFVDQPQYNQTYLQHEGPDEFWATTNIQGHYENVKWPAVHLAGWWDVFQKDNLLVYEGYRTLGDPSVRDLQFLIINPGGHCFTGGSVAWSNFSQKVLQALPILIQDLVFTVMNGPRTPKGTANRLSLLRILARPIPRVIWYVMGPGLPGTRGNWITAANQLPTPTMTPFYLAPNGELLRKPSTESATEGFIFNPGNPLGTWGGCNMASPPGFAIETVGPCGPWDQLQLYEGRTDVLLYTSAPLGYPMAVTGFIKAVLYVSTNATDTDFTAKLVDVFPNGTRLLIADGIQRMRWRELKKGPQLLVPGKVYRVEVDLWGTSYIFPTGHSIGVDISSSNFPRFDVNPNTGDPLAESTQHPEHYVFALNTIHMETSYASRIELPVVPLRAVTPLLHEATEELMNYIRHSTSEAAKLEAEM